METRPNPADRRASRDYLAGGKDRRDPVRRADRCARYADLDRPGSIGRARFVVGNIEARADLAEVVHAAR